MFKVWGLRLMKVCEVLWNIVRSVKHSKCGCERLEVWGVSCLNYLNMASKVLLLLQSFSVHDIVDVHGCYWWLLHLLKHFSNWNVYNFGGDYNNMVCNNTFTSTIDKVSLQAPLLNFMCFEFFCSTFFTLLSMFLWTFSN
jgi:hypothetical protein